MPKAYYEYKLRGIVIHLGNADAGHYYSFIKDSLGEKGGPKDQWYEFNDKDIKVMDEANIPQEAFGGEDESLGNMGYGRQDARNFRIKSRNAYLLFYERKAGHIDMEKFGEAQDSPSISIDENEMN